MNTTASSASLSRWQHGIPATIVLLLTCVVVYLSYTREPSAAFLFPRLISSFMLILATWNFIRALTGLARVGDGLKAETVKNIAPGVLVMIALVYVAAKALGFYAASYVAFLALFTMYDPAPHTALRTWGKRLLITTAFMLIIYALFTLLLKVQTPRGMFL